jgi:DNA-binding NarL/FixJ family response regulator
LEKKNEIYFDCLVEYFKSISQNELIKKVIQKVTVDDIDAVLLDFRLLPIDFTVDKIEEITGVKILQEIKKLTPGILVIIFFATNKIWNLQAYQDAGLDGFILKESLENSIDKDFTKSSEIT